jgi:DNA-binding CsgD family transcriptional regulator
MDDLAVRTLYGTDGRLRRAAADPMRDTSIDLGDLPAALLLADAQGLVIDRWTGSAAATRLMDRRGVVPGIRCQERETGTNAIGSALISRGSSVVRGPEHDAERLADIACAAQAVTDPLTGRVLGVITILSLVRVYTPVMPALVGRLVQETQQRLLSNSGAPRPRPAWARLTAAERIVAQHVAQGLTNRETASLLHLSPHTIDYHLRRIFQKLQVRSRVELARMLTLSPLTDR